MNSDKNRTHPLILHDLPENILYEILAKLPIKEAVRTSLISAFWRHRWRSLPDLRLQNLPEAVISRILLLHHGPIRRFLLIHPSLTPPPSTDSWLIFLSSSTSLYALRTLALCFTHQTPSALYPLHSSAFSFSFLNTLYLVNCYLTLPRGFVGFKHLLTLKLYRVRINGGELSRLISTASTLKVVYLVNTKGEGCLRIQGRNIETIYSNTTFDDFALGSCPSLKNAAINVKDNGGELIARHDCMHWLPLGRHGLQDMLAFMNPENVPFTFACLSAMVVQIDFADIRSVLSSLCLLRSCPNIKSLCVSGVYQNEYAVGSRDILVAIWDYDIFSKLQTVEFINFMSKEFEIEALRFILEKAVLLDKAMITFHKTMFTSKEVSMKKLLELRRTSNKAKIICTC